MLAHLCIAFMLSTWKEEESDTLWISSQLLRCCRLHGAVRGAPSRTFWSRLAPLLYIWAFVRYSRPRITPYLSSFADLTSTTAVTSFCAPGKRGGSRCALTAWPNFASLIYIVLDSQSPFISPRSSHAGSAWLLFSKKLSSSSIPALKKVFVPEQKYDLNFWVFIRAAGPAVDLTADCAAADTSPVRNLITERYLNRACTGVHHTLMRQSILGLIQRCSRQQQCRSAGILGGRGFSNTLPENVRQQIEENRRNRAEVPVLHTVRAV